MTLLTKTRSGFSEATVPAGGKARSKPGEPFGSSPTRGSYTVATRPGAGGSTLCEYDAVAAARKGWAPRRYTRVHDPGAGRGAPEGGPLGARNARTPGRLVPARSPQTEVVSLNSSSPTTGHGFCASCGAPRTDPDQAFCSVCGAPVSVAARAPSASAVRSRRLPLSPLIAGMLGGGLVVVAIAAAAVFVVLGSKSPEPLATFPGTGGIVIDPSTLSCSQPENITVTVRYPASVKPGDMITTKVDGKQAGNPSSFAPTVQGDYPGSSASSAGAWDVGSTSLADGSWAVTMYLQGPELQALCTAGSEVTPGSLGIDLTPGSHAIQLVDSTGKVIAEGSYTVAP